MVELVDIKAADNQVGETNHDANSLMVKQSSNVTDTKRLPIRTSAPPKVSPPFQVPTAALAWLLINILFCLLHFAW